MKYWIVNPIFLELLLQPFNPSTTNTHVYIYDIKNMQAYKYQISKRKLKLIIT